MRKLFDNILSLFTIFCILNLFNIKPANGIYDLNFAFNYLLYSFLESILIGLIVTIITIIIKKIFK